MSNQQVLYPKDDFSSLYPNDKVSQRVTRYSDEHSSSIPKHIVNYHAHIQATEPKTASYMISISQAKAMAFLAKTVVAKRGMPPNCLIHDAIKQERVNWIWE
jgi:hypothetical protein